MKHAVILMVLTVLIAVPCQGAPTETAIGMGKVSCEEWTNARHDKSATLYEKWVLSFVSTVKILNSSQSGGPPPKIDTEDVLAWIDSHCRAHPIDNISGAAVAYSQRTAAK